MKKTLCLLLVLCLLPGILPLVFAATAFSPEGFSPVKSLSAFAGAVPVEPMPVDPTFEDPTLVDSTPADATPTAAMPMDATPTDATSTDATPTDATPTDATPTDATPTDVTPTDATPTDATPTDATPKDILGDVDGDGVIKPADARLALRASVKLENIAESSAAFYAADVDADGKITPDDARTILRLAVKLDQLFIFSGLRVIYTGYEKKLSKDSESAGDQSYDGYCYLTYINTTPHEINVGFCRTCVNGFWTRMYYVIDGNNTEDGLAMRLAPGEKHDLALDLNYPYSKGEIVPEEVVFVEITLSIFDSESKESYLSEPIISTTGAALGEDRAPSSPVLYREEKNGCSVSVLSYDFYNNSPRINAFVSNGSDMDYWVFPVVHYKDGTEEYMYLDFFVPAGKKAVASAITVMPPEKTVDAIYFRVYGADWLHLRNDELLFEIGPFVPGNISVPTESE